MFLFVRFFIQFSGASLNYKRVLLVLGNTKHARSSEITP